MGGGRLRRVDRGRRWVEDLPVSPWRWLLLPAWALFAVASRWRGWAYDRGWLPVHRAAIPVLSVGNLVAGGAGKTPVAILLAQRLRALGHRPAIVSRGYRALGDGRNEEAHLAGDIPVICDADRVRGVAAAAAQGATVAVLDDGFQHRRLHRQLDVVVVDATRPWGDPSGGWGWMLPMGLRREALPALRRAQVLWIGKADLAAVPPALPDLAVPVLHERIAAVDGVPAGEAPWLLVSGIGNPDGFERLAERVAPGRAVEHWRFGDHHRYRGEDASAIAGRARELGAVVVTTGKDAVKLAPLLPGAQVLRMQAALEAGEAAVLDALLRAAAGPPPAG